MLILGRDQLKDPSLGYARTFVSQLEDCLGLALEKGVRIVSNAGGLNPAGLADRLREVARGSASPAIAYVDGDDVRSPLDMGGAPRADRQRVPRRVRHRRRARRWRRRRGHRPGHRRVPGGRAGRLVARLEPTSYDDLAGAVVAGHVIECGCQATGGNFSGFGDDRALARPLGFPFAEVAVDGRSVITKHDGTGGAVTVDTVTAQLLYEVQGTEYLGPRRDHRPDLDPPVRRWAADRVRVTGVRGSAPPERLKVGVNELGGHRNSVEFVLTGLDVEDKAAWVRSQLSPSLTASSVTWTRSAPSGPDADTEEGASTVLRCTVQDASPEAVGRAFSAPPWSWPSRRTPGSP